VGIPEFTPAEMPLAGYLILEGISHFVEAGTSNPSGMRGCQLDKVLLGGSSKSWLSIWADFPVGNLSARVELIRGLVQPDLRGAVSPRWLPLRAVVIIESGSLGREVVH